MLVTRHDVGLIIGFIESLQENNPNILTVLRFLQITTAQIKSSVFISFGCYYPAMAAGSRCTILVLALSQ
jgi:hypothetical protein